LEAQEPEDAVGAGTAGEAPAAEAAAASAANPADDFADDEFEKLIEREVERPKRAKKPAALIQMDGTNFTCLGQPDFPDYVPAI